MGQPSAFSTLCGAQQHRRPPCRGVEPPYCEAETRRVTSVSIEQLSQSPHGPQIPHTGCGLGQPKQFRCFSRGKMLKMPQQHDLPIGLVELVDRSSKPPLELLPGGCGCRRQLAVDHRLSRCRGHRVVGARLMNRDLPVDAAAGCHTVTAVGVDQPVSGHVSQPETKRHRRVGQVVTKPTIRLNHHILHNIAGVDTALHTSIHAGSDQPTNRLAVPSKQPVNGRGIALPNAIEQHLRHLRIGRIRQREPMRSKVVGDGEFARAHRAPFRDGRRVFMIPLLPECCLAARPNPVRGHAPPHTASRTLRLSQLFQPEMSTAIHA